MIVVNGILKYKLDLVGVLEVRWDRGGAESAGKYTVACLLHAGIVESRKSVNTAIRQ
jgi:hypothetical protein